MKIHFFLTVVLFSVVFTSCNDNTDNEKNVPAQKPFSEQGVKEQFVKANQQQLAKENDEINYYIKTHSLPFVNTASGIRYHVYKPSAKGDSIREGMEITMDYVVSLLNGTKVYSSAKEGKKTFIVGHADLETGIHKGVQYLKRGDKAVLIMPSALAHGLLGDMNKIPPHMPIVYDVTLY